jgi:hypothetical protein
MPRYRQAAGRGRGFMDEREETVEALKRISHCAADCEVGVIATNPVGDSIEMDLEMFLKGFAFGMMHAASICHEGHAAERDPMEEVKRGVDSFVLVCRPELIARAIKSGLDDVSTTTECDDREL